MNINKDSKPDLKMIPTDIQKDFRNNMGKCFVGSGVVEFNNMECLLTSDLRENNIKLFQITEENDFKLIHTIPNINLP